MQTVSKVSDSTVKVEVEENLTLVLSKALLNIHDLAMKQMGSYGYEKLALPISEIIEKTGITRCIWCNKPIFRNQPTRAIQTLRYHESCYFDMESEKAEYDRMKKVRGVATKQ